MINPPEQSSPQERNLWLVLFITIGYVLAALLAFNVIGVLAIMPLYEMDISRVLEVLSNPMGHPSSRIPLLIVQGITSFGAFVLTPWFVLNRYLNVQIKPLFRFYPSSLHPYLMTFFITLAFMGVNSFFIEWNSNVQLPESWGWFEQFAESKEDQLAELTRFLTDFIGFGHFLLGFVVIAILPAIGEELLFRGLLQNLFQRIFKNPHIGIWLTAFLFGAFHLQFYGLVPRMLLGVIFGYVYYLSGYLTFAMLSHFINNGLMVTLLYLGSVGIVDYNWETDAESLPILAVFVLFVLVCSLLWIFNKYFNSSNNEPVAKGF